MSIGPTATASTSPTAPTSFRPKRRCGRNGATGRRRNSLVTAACNSFPSPSGGGAGVGTARLFTDVDVPRRLPTPTPPSPQGGGSRPPEIERHPQPENQRLL